MVSIPKRLARARKVFHFVLAGTLIGGPRPRTRSSEAGQDSFLEGRHQPALDIGIRKGTRAWMFGTGVTLVVLPLLSACQSSATVPGAPTGVLDFARPGATQVVWSAPTSDGGSAITSYQVGPMVSGSQSSACPLAVTVSATATSVWMPWGSPGCMSYAVRAVNSVGPSAWATESLAALQPHVATQQSWNATLLSPYTASTNLTASMPGRTVNRDGGFSAPTGQP